ncbi:hypothetical protein [Parachlamydia acanthamoebae]|uniref:hypothetical protein n=1 Tax=Parachlamydia acanthamoebae TaxID=83552 RepID=UPI0001C175B2|nr:hypothetical protein [Parachlamydia acanthamoebae]EFB40298.1 hypothetical protein pah_c209o021 [Parachlamydia acanthamoebae str. Hall's coccus]
MSSELPPDPASQEPEKDPKESKETPPPEKDKLDTFYGFAKKNTRDTAAYVLLLIGIIWSFFNSFYGGVLVGLVAGAYYSEEILTFIKSIKEEIEEYGTASSLILAGTLLAFFVASPGIFLGGTIVIALKEALASSGKNT